jgi:hypothetical protein
MLEINQRSIRDQVTCFESCPVISNYLLSSQQVTYSELIICSNCLADISKPGSVSLKSDHFESVPLRSRGGSFAIQFSACDTDVFWIV